MFTDAYIIDKESQKLRQILKKVAASCGHFREKLRQKLRERFSRNLSWTGGKKFKGDRDGGFFSETMITFLGKISEGGTKSPKVLKKSQKVAKVAENCGKSKSLPRIEKVAEHRRSYDFSRNYAIANFGTP